MHCGDFLVKCSPNTLGLQMYIEYYKSNGIEYARLRKSIRKSNEVSHDKSTTLGRVLDKQRLIFRNRTDGTFLYDAQTGERKTPPEDFGVKVVRSNAREQLIVDFGNAYFVDKYIERHKLWPVFESIGYGNLDSFKALLGYYILEKSSNAHAEDWYDGSYARIIYPKALLQSPRISDMLKAIGKEDVLRRFFHAYISYLKEETIEAGKGCILIDSTGLPNDMRLPVTAVSNHNGEINNEVRLIYAVQRGTGMPIYMRYIPGNVIDVSTLLTTVAELKAMRFETNFAILDAGYLTLESMDELLDQKVSFLSRVKKNWKFYKDILKEHRATLDDEKNLQVFNGRFVYLKMVKYKNAKGRTLYCYLGLDDERKSNERRLLAKQAEEEELSKGEIAQRMENMGIFMLVCTRRIAVKDLLPLYYTRQDIEQVFDITKGYAKALPLCVQTEETFRGHLLMVFCSTIVIRLLQQELLKTNYNLDDFLHVMRNQKAKVFEDAVIPCEATKKQNDLYKLAHISSEVSIKRVA